MFIGEHIVDDLYNVPELKVSNVIGKILKGSLWYRLLSQQRSMDDRGGSGARRALMSDVDGS